ncbi:transcription termination factor NusA, partial [bacterium]|nr:transcription termination factor NusA [bacterium]
MSKEVLDIINRISLERNIPVQTLQDALEAALISASKKMLPPDVEVVEAELDRESGEFRIYANMEVVEEIEDEFTQILLEEARQYVDDVSPGEFLVIDVTPEDFGRIAAQSAKQVITQRIREAEREIIFDKYKNRTGDLVAGTVQRYEKGNVVVDLGNAEAILPNREQPQGERYRFGDRVKAIIADIRKSSKDAQIILSRTSPELVLKLFEQEVAEIKDGIVSIRLIAREPGRRTKIAVLSSDSDVDPVGACVGMKGSRVQMVVQELRGERIDIIEYSDDKQRFVANSLKPANIESVELDVKGTRALLVVQDDELALAIGKNGLNAKLASQLTRCEIDIITESQLNARELQAKK